MAKATGAGLDALQRAVFSVLNRAPITTTHGAKVYDDIPQTTTLPVVRIDVVPGEPWDTMGRAGQEHFVELHVFAQSPGGVLRLAALVDALTGILDGAALPVVGYRVWDVARMAQQRGEDEIIGGVKTLHRIAPFLVRMTEGEQP